jgi:hypothetical protein
LNWKTEGSTTGLCIILLRQPAEQITSTDILSQDEEAGETVTKIYYTYSPSSIAPMIEDEHSFRLFAKAPGLYSLPSPALKVHARLWTLIGTVGLTERNNQKAIRMGFKRKPTGAETLAGYSKRSRGSHPGRDPTDESGSKAHTGDAGGAGGTDQGPGTGDVFEAEPDSSTAGIGGNVPDGNKKGAKTHSSSTPGCEEGTTDYAARSERSTASSECSGVAAVATARTPLAPRHLGLRFSPWLFSQVLERGVNGSTPSAAENMITAARSMVTPATAKAKVKAMM